MKQKVYLIDGSGFIFRAYHALPPLTRPDGTPVGAVLGFTNMLVKLLLEMKAHKVAVIFDAARANFRHTLYPLYKNNRRETPEDLIPQFPLMRDVCAAFSVPAMEKEGFEADDLIATYALEAKAQGYEVVIVSSDKDLMQLVGDGIVLWDHMKNKTISVPEVVEKFGVPPVLLGDLLALTGDTSDNVPGVPGIGPKTAADLLTQFGSLGGIYENLDKISQVKRRTVLEENKENAFLSRKLVTLSENIPLEKSLDELEVGPRDPEKLKAFLELQGFNRLLARLSLDVDTPTPVAASIDTSYVTIDTMDQLQAWGQRIRKQGYVAIDTETTSLRAVSAKLVGISLCLAPGEAAYIPVGHQQDLFTSQKQLPIEAVLDFLKPICLDATLTKIGHNIKYDMLVLKKYGVVLEGIEDTMVLSYLLGPGPHGLDELALTNFQHAMISFKTVLGKRSNFSEVSIPEATQYAAEDADYTLRLWQLLKPQLLAAGSLPSAYETIELPLIPVLVEMENTGIRINAPLLRQLSVTFAGFLATLEEEIYALAGVAFNIGSPKQLGEVLFDRHQLPGGKKNKLGAYATSADILEYLAQEKGSVLCEKVLEWRQFSKLKSTYTEGLISEMDPKTQRVHTTYSMASTNTGRLASSDPNLQNIPIRREIGRQIRSAFVAEEGSVLVSLDYSQIELRLLAYMANIESLKAAFEHGQDIHTLTASQVFGIPVEKIDAVTRAKAKAINFGIIYGISPFGLAKQLGIDREEAAFYIEAYNKQYPGILAYMEEQKQLAQKQGYVETLFKRRCYMPLVHSKVFSQRSFAFRQAINAPLQGSNADIIKRSMIAIQKALVEAKMKSRMLLQVHDELVFEVPVGEQDALIALAQGIMQNAALPRVPLIVDFGVGPTWASAH